jgi:translation initiation factor IF-1
VAEVLSERTFRVELSNGHRLLGFIPVRSRDSGTALSKGDRVKLQLTPYDLSSGRIVLVK